MTYEVVPDSTIELEGRAAMEHSMVVDNQNVSWGQSVGYLKICNM